jgi:hypothetical protein
MAAYIAWYGKKLAALGQCEQELIESITANAPLAKISACAEKVRLAHIRALKSKRAQFPPSEKSAVAMNGFENRVAFWANVPVETIIAGYRTGRFQRERPARCLRGVW